MMPRAAGSIAFLSLFSAAAQEPPVLPDPYAEERKAYDEIYSGQQPGKPQVFNTRPNAFMVRTITGLTPGRALDVAMGQGRNALWLAAQGWNVTGFDISPAGITEA